MPGELKYTAANDTAKQTSNTTYAEAFCEGRRDWIESGTNLNPHTSGSPRYTAYEAGYATTTPQGLVDNCAYAIPILVPSLTGLTSAAAQTAIIAAGLLVGKITGATGVVTVQNPATSAKAQPNDVVTFTIA
jgi:hypothetical protein